MKFLRRHVIPFLFGIATILANNWLRLRPTNLEALMGAVLTLAATLTAIFVGFVSILLSMKDNALFRNMFLDLKILESLLLGTVFYLIVSFISIIGFFLPENFSGIDWFMSAWLCSLVIAASVTCSLVMQLFGILHGLWVQRYNEDLYK
ncbi:hypothetical protein [Lacticaseibacillus paracasei]|uniref:hypothetical protein n=1 Tax=Lacticaseibacillus paracasei TaxID=1597 RepID=UPI003399066F